MESLLNGNGFEPDLSNFGFSDNVSNKDKFCAVMLVEVACCLRADLRVMSDRRWSPIRSIA